MEEINQTEGILTASEEQVNDVSERLLTRNLEAYLELAK